MHRRGDRRTGVRRKELAGRQLTAGVAAGVAADVEDGADAGDVDTTWCAHRWSAVFKKISKR